MLDGYEIAETKIIPSMTLCIVSEIACVSILYFVQNNVFLTAKNYVLGERPSTSPTATTSTPPAPANHQTPDDNGKFVFRNISSCTH